jgi:murein DD-endopeptidase MepM/ murein hydrolase activator NlpD
MSQYWLNVPIKVRISEVLVQKRLITKQSNLALAAQSNTQLKLGEILIQQGPVTPHQLNRVLKVLRRRNWTTSVLFVLSFLGFATPKLLPSGALATIAPLTEPISAIDGKGGGTTVTRKKILPQNLHAFKTSPNNELESPLSTNLRPTVASPLTGFCHPLNGAGILAQGIRGQTHRGRMEYAYDLTASIGTPVYAMRAGRVISVEDRYPDTGGSAENMTKFNYVLIEHEGGYRSAYLHLQQGFQGKAQLAVNDTVESGQLISYSGNSGWSSGPHLHVEVQKPGEILTFNPTVPFAIAGACKPGSIANQNRRPT